MPDHQPPTETDNTPASYRDETAYPLSVGQQVHDIRKLVTSAEHEGVAVVVDTPDENVHEATFVTTSGDIASVADYDLNQHYADYEVSDRVVTIRWDSWLDSHVPRWRDHADTPERLRSYLREYESSWGVAVSADGYPYPESRLVPITE